MKTIYLLPSGTIQTNDIIKFGEITISFKDLDSILITLHTKNISHID